MMMIQIIQMLANVLTFIVIIQVVLSYFMSPYHPVRQTIDRIVEPLLAPIRRILPPMGALDFSPLVLILLIQLVEYLLTRLMLSFVL